jgi:hypothetical protein
MDKVLLCKTLKVVPRRMILWPGVHFTCDLEFPQHESPLVLDLALLIRVFSLGILEPRDLNTSHDKLFSAVFLQQSNNQ